MEHSVCAKAKRQIRAVILDAGGVIIHPDLDWIGEQIRRERVDCSPSWDTLLEAYYRTIYALDLEPDAVSRKGLAFTALDIRHWFFTKLLSHSGVVGDELERAANAIARRALERFPRESDIYHWCMPGTLERLERLRGGGYLLGCASNNDDALEAQLHSVGVHHLFSVLKDSGREGVAKPDPELLLRAAREIGAPPSHCLYVGDVDSVDGAAARAAGMAFALLDPLEQPRPSRPLCICSLDAIHDHFSPI